MKLTRYMPLKQVNKIILLILIFTFQLTWSQIIREKYIEKIDSVAEKAEKLRYKYPDSAKVILQQRFEQVLPKDTIKAIDILLRIANISGTNAEYMDSYDAFWKALLLVDEIDNEMLKSVIYKRLGRFYGYSGRKEQSFEYLNKSLSIDKDLVAKGVLEKGDLVVDYYLLSSNYREAEEIELAHQYIDSCFLYYSESRNPIDKAYLNFEKAVVTSLQGNKHEAIELIKTLIPWFNKNDPSYLVLVYKYWGDIYLDLGDLKKSEVHYNKALQNSENYNSHIDFTPLIYEKLTELYVRKEDYKKAFENQQKAKNLDVEIFDSRSKRNQSLLEIKDKFRIEKKKQEDLIQLQHIKQLEQEEEITNLQRIILIAVIVFLVIIGVVYFNYLKSKHKTEKLLIRKNKELEIKKAQELLELKNKELASSALQLIEKDEFLKTLKAKVKGTDGSIKTQEVNRLLRTISVSNNNNWEEFKLRFIEVNKEFYEQISSKHPKLSQGDQKICALIKLNFSSKDMARLLGISVESVHTTRYRLRKKMGLSRSTNLEDYINSI
ncbi:hypothetical protein EGM88_04550 [Aureibaculum marinum]|uniref:HTH luxR-type domain-containing protein n=1 Tax=Aureibaculum marinum TaxID=2487930 RepID=A0A3N4PHU7_9FLAO|nr:hypothetical protein [Aureibaculum marinum]RPD99123.1 hypothetical protein EGM88_04550 [Aureibaculum marinum]